MRTPLVHTELWSAAEARGFQLADAMIPASEDGEGLPEAQAWLRYTAMDAIALAIYVLAVRDNCGAEQVALSELAWTVRTREAWIAEVAPILSRAGHDLEDPLPASDALAARWARLCRPGRDGLTPLDRHLPQVGEFVDQQLATAHFEATPAEDPSHEWTVFSRRTVYADAWGAFGFADVAKPGSRERFKHHWFQLRPAAMTVAVQADYVLMAHRHRWVPQQTEHNQLGWELPGGLIDPGERAEETAARELHEESGYQAEKLELLHQYEPAVGSLDAPHHVFLATELKHVGAPREQDEGQFQWVPLSSLRELLANGELVSSGSLIGVQALLDRFNR